jgi:hypothetical protein
MSRVPPSVASEPRFRASPRQGHRHRSPMWVHTFLLSCPGRTRPQAPSPSQLALATGHKGQASRRQQEGDSGQLGRGHSGEVSGDRTGRKPCSGSLDPIVPPGVGASSALSPARLDTPGVPGSGGSWALRTQAPPCCSLPGPQPQFPQLQNLRGC